MRDRIPEIIKAAGKKARIKQVTAAEYQVYLKEKLQEEVEKFLESGDPGELADILEVILALSAVEVITFDALVQMDAKKREARGGFDKGIILVSVEDGEKHKSSI